jgi:predicted ATP-grasp superfamily ATP-dependent carboligase
MYLLQNNNDPNYIHKGAVKKYTILDNDNYEPFKIFEKIFKKINYTGFACSDFIVEDNNLLIFEINPRMGGSMRKNKFILNSFFDVLVNNF